MPDPGLCLLQLRLQRRFTQLASLLHLTQDFLITIFAPRSAGHGALVHGLEEMGLHDQLNVFLPGQRHPLAGKRHALRITCWQTRLHRKRLCTHGRNISEKLYSSRAPCGFTLTPLWVRRIFTNTFM